MDKGVMRKSFSPIFSPSERMRNDEFTEDMRD